VYAPIRVCLYLYVCLSVHAPVCVYNECVCVHMRVFLRWGKSVCTHVPCSINPHRRSWWARTHGVVGPSWDGLPFSSAAAAAAAAVAAAVAVAIVVGVGEGELARPHGCGVVAFAGPAVGLKSALQTQDLQLQSVRPPLQDFELPVLLL